MRRRHVECGPKLLVTWILSLWLGLLLVALESVLLLSPVSMAQTPEPGVASGAVETLGDVEGAVVLVIGDDVSMLEPDGSVTEGQSTGSGFLVSPDGSIVTNAHVIAGASDIHVLSPLGAGLVPARLVGHSVCSDLAVLDIDVEDAGYLGWRSEPVTVGLEVFAAGHPDGDPRYALYDGIVARSAGAAPDPRSSPTSRSSTRRRSDQAHLVVPSSMRTAWS